MRSCQGISCITDSDGLADFSAQFAILNVVPFIGSPAYSAEQEARIVHLVPADYELGFYPGRLGIVPYVTCGSAKLSDADAKDLSS